MKKTGQLTINGNESRLDDGTLLARCAASDPIGSGTAFLKNKGLEDGDACRDEGAREGSEAQRQESAVEEVPEAEEDSKEIHASKA